MFYNNNFWGMGIIWWSIWVVLIFWIFATHYDIPGERGRKELPLEILKKCFAAGEITNEEYQESKKNIEAGLTR